MSTAYQPLTNPQGQAPQQPMPQYAGAPQQYAGQPVAYAGQPVQYVGQPQQQQYMPPNMMYGAGANQTVVAVAMPNPGLAEVNMQWVAQQVDTTSCYLKILATLIVAYSIYALAISSQSMYTSGWDIASGVLLLITGLIGLAAGITNKTVIARVYFWALVVMTVILTIGYIIVLAVTAANPCKNVDDGTDSGKNASKVCDYSLETIRAILIILALIVVGCCLCCTFCARMHLKNLELRDNNGVARA